MSRYIDADKLSEMIQAKADTLIEGKEAFLYVAKWLELLPPADVVEVVRCKDCEYCCMSTDPKTNISVQVCGYVGYNPVQSSQVTDNDYCSHGERSENGK